MMKENVPRTPFGVEIKIFDESGKKMFHWYNDNNGNMLKGFNKAIDYAYKKLGVRGRNIEDMRKNVQEMIDDAFGIKGKER